MTSTATAELCNLRKCQRIFPGVLDRLFEGTGNSLFPPARANVEASSVGQAVGLDFHAEAFADSTLDVLLGFFTGWRGQMEQRGRQKHGSRANQVA